MSSVKAAVTLPIVAADRRANHEMRSRLSARSGRRTTPMLAAGLSFGAGAIHLAVAGSHLGPMGDLALGFYCAALFQFAFGLALFADPGSRRLMRLGVGINAALIGAWGLSRTVGVPTVPGGPETIGVADATTVAFQVLLVAWLLIRLAPPAMIPRRRSLDVSPSAIRAPLFVAALAAVALATGIAVTDGLTGHGHHGQDPDLHADHELRTTVLTSSVA